MGYTHYWSHGVMDKETFEEIKSDAMDILVFCEEQGIAFGNYAGVKDSEPVFKEYKFGFNGIEELSHETFWLGIEPNEFNFTKTARKPYDLAVCMTLLSLAYHVEGASVRSDGDIDEEWISPIVTWHRLFPNRSVAFSYDGQFIAHELTTSDNDFKQEVQGLLCSSDERLREKGVLMAQGNYSKK
jgi:hypothetical protein